MTNQELTQAFDDKIGTCDFVKVRKGNKSQLIDLADNIDEFMHDYYGFGYDEHLPLAAGVAFRYSLHSSVLNEAGELEGLEQVGASKFTLAGCSFQFYSLNISLI